MRIFKTRWFHRWCRKERISDKALCKAVKEIEQGLIEAYLGGDVYKKRIAQPGQGKRGSTRTIVAFRSGDKTFFMFGFAKNKRANIDSAEEKALKLLAKELLEHDEAMLVQLLTCEELFEVITDE